MVLPLLPAPPTALDDPDFVAKMAAYYLAIKDFVPEFNAHVLAFGPGAPWCAAGGTANAITLTSGLSIGSLVAGQSASWVAGSDNSGATTINLDGTGAVAAVTSLGAALPAGWINAGEIMSATYDGSNWKVYPSQAYLDAREAVASLFDETVASTAAHDRIFGTAWRSVEIDIHNLVPATNGAVLRMRLGNASAVMESAADDYELSLNGAAGVTATFLTLSGAISNTAGMGYKGTIKILGAQSAATRTGVNADGGYEPSAGAGYAEARMKGGRRGLVQHQSFSLFMSTGNFTAERITVRGVR